MKKNKAVGRWCSLERSLIHYINPDFNRLNGKVHLLTLLPFCNRSMSIVPINQGRQDGGSNSLDLWDPFSLDIWEPFRDFPIPSAISPFFDDFGFGGSVNTRLDWKETPRAHVWKVVLPGFTNQDVLVELLDGRMLQVSLESGDFMSRFKIPQDAKLEHLKATMNHGVLIVTVPKHEPDRSGVRVVEIEGSG